MRLLVMLVKAGIRMLLLADLRSVDVIILVGDNKESVIRAM